MGDHKTYIVDSHSSYTGRIDPVTRTAFKVGEEILVCPKTNEAIALRSLSASENKCPFCGQLIGVQAGIFPVASPIKAGQNGPVKSSKPGYYPASREEKQYSWALIGFLAVFIVLILTGTIVIRSLPMFSGSKSSSSPTQTDQSSPTNESPTAEVSTIVPTKLTSGVAGEDGWIIYAYGKDQVGGSESTTGRDLYIINTKTHAQLQMTFGNLGNNFPSFSPDGEKVVYTGCRPDCKLYILDIASGNEEKIPGISAKAMAPKWCASKPWIVFEARQNGNRQTSLSMVDLNDYQIKNLTKGPADSRPVWSPDCSKILFGRATADTNRDGSITTNDRLDIYIYDLESEATSIQMETADADEFGYTWSPNNSLIAFTRVSEDTDHNGQITLDDQSDLFLYNLETKQETNLTKGRYSAFSPSFSFDGNFIVFTSYGGYGNRIIIYSLLDSTFTDVTDAGDYFHASWKP